MRIMRYITDEDVFRVLSEYYHHKTDIQHAALSEAISRVPTADVVEIKRGKWEQGRCSECGYDWGKDVPIASVPNFCPNCGADMRKRSEDGCQ